MADSRAAAKLNDKYRIGLDARGAILYRGTGIGTYAYQLAHELRKLHGGDVKYLMPGSEFCNLDFADTAVFSRLANSLNYYSDEFLPNWLSENKIDLYHVPQNGIGLPTDCACKRVVTIHDLIPYVYPETVGRSYLKQFLGQMSEIMRQADGIIAVSEYTKTDIMRYFDYPEDRIRVIYEAAEPVYAPTAKDTCKEVLRRQYGIEKDYLLYVGGFGTRKNLTCLLTAFSQIVNKGEREIALVCPGKSERAKGYLKELAKALGIEKSVIFPGFVPVNILPYFYGGAEILVYPSLYEGFGLPVLEAMACGCPVLAADNSSLPEIGGKAAEYFNAMDSKSLADAMLSVLEDAGKRAAMIRAGLERSALFDWQKNAEETWDFYKEILERPFI